MMPDRGSSRAPWRYYFDFVAFPPVVAAAVAADARSLYWWLLFVAGACSFTFVEYWTHRAVLHGLYWHGAHERHHEAPSEYVIFPLWYTPAIFAALFLVLPLPVFAGFTAGYIWFMLLHHALHHWSLRKATWLHRYAIWHNQHHVLTDRNYGITTNVWDRVFGTYRS